MNPVEFAAVHKSFKGKVVLRGVDLKVEPDKIVAARLRSPLVIGIGEGKNYVASDMAAVRPQTDQVYIIEDGEAAVHASRIDLVADSD